MLAKFALGNSYTRLFGNGYQRWMADLAGINPRQLRGSRAPGSNPVKRNQFLSQLRDGVIAELAKRGLSNQNIAYLVQRQKEIPDTQHDRFEPIIALAEHPDKRLPHTRAVAAQIDSISDNLISAYRDGGLHGARDLIIEGPTILAPLAVPEIEAATPLSVRSVVEMLASASEESEIRGLIRGLSLMALFTVFGRLDVETMQHWDVLEFRSLFVLLLPQRSENRIRHPMSRLIDFMACCAFGGEDDVAAGHVPTAAEIKTPILNELGGNEDRLNTWRNGRSFLTFEQAIRVWEALHRYVDREPPMPPVAMIVTANVFQNCLVAYDDKRRAVKGVLCGDDLYELYELWWRYYSDRVDRSQAPARPMAWPACFDRV